MLGLAGLLDAALEDIERPDADRTGAAGSVCRCVAGEGIGVRGAGRFEVG